MRVCGLLDHELAEVIEFYPTQAEANVTLAEILGDEPGWESKLEIVRVDFGGAGVRVERV